MSNNEELDILSGYAAWAPDYDSDGNPLIAVEEPVMQAWYGPLEGCQVLDLGCGTGRHTLPLAMTGARVVAMDGSDGMLARARHKLYGFPVEWRRGWIEPPLPFADLSFDLVVMALVAEHLNDLVTVFRDLQRICKVGGRLLLSDLHPDRTATGQKARFIDRQTGERRHIKTYHRTVGEVLGAAEQAGWALIDETTLVVSDELARSLPRALPYAGLNLGWVAHWKKVG